MKKRLSFLLILLLVALTCSPAMAKGFSIFSFLSALDSNLESSLASAGLLRKEDLIASDYASDGAFRYLICDPDSSLPSYGCFIQTTSDGNTISKCIIVADDPYTFNLDAPMRIIYAGRFFETAVEAMAEALSPSEKEDFCYTYPMYVDNVMTDPYGSYKDEFHPCGDYVYAVESYARNNGYTPSSMTESMQTWCSVIFALK